MSDVHSTPSSVQLEPSYHGSDTEESVIEVPTEEGTGYSHIDTWQRGSPSPISWRSRSPTPSALSENNAPPPTPVEVLGWRPQPNLICGQVFNQMCDLAETKIAEYRDECHQMYRNLRRSPFDPSLEVEICTVTHRLQDLMASAHKEMLRAFLHYHFELSEPCHDITCQMCLSSDIPAVNRRIHPYLYAEHLKYQSVRRLVL